MIKEMMLLKIFTAFCMFECCLAINSLPAVFIFGDSLVDVGNNNYLLTLSKANYHPNGIDFGRPTGRFCNGKTVADLIGQEIGLDEFIPPYMAPTTRGPIVLKGVNYASGAGGILNETGFFFGDRINLDRQIDNFANTRKFIVSTIGTRAAEKLLADALFAISIGSNDFINNYLTPILSDAERKKISPAEFVDTLIARFRRQITRIYSMGARKILVVNVGPIGCIPYQRELNPQAGSNCVDHVNQMAELFNNELKMLIEELNYKLKTSTFVYGDAYRIVSDIIRNYLSYGFESANSACCFAAGRFGGLIPCGPVSKVCRDRSKYVFWDPYHPSEAANAIVAQRLLDGGEEVIWPMNVRDLLQT